MERFAVLLVLSSLGFGQSTRSLCPSSLRGICVEKCNVNSPCPDGQACCSDGCGHSCYNICQQQSDCKTGYACCSGGCGHQKVCRVEEPAICPLLLCANQCEFGYRMDIDGCPSCQCCTSWCDHKCYPCKPGQVCRPADIYCITTPCPQSQCVDVPNANQPAIYPCPLIKCQDNCQFGYKLDKDGCQTCQCCKSYCDQDCYPCKPGEDCVETPIKCLIPPCPQSKCVRKEPAGPPDCAGCSLVRCGYGTRPGGGCATCTCCEEWCDPACFRCDPGQRCEVVTECSDDNCSIRRCVPVGN